MRPSLQRRDRFCAPLNRSFVRRPILVQALLWFILLYSHLSDQALIRAVDDGQLPQNICLLHFGWALTHRICEAAPTHVICREDVGLFVAHIGNSSAHQALEVRFHSFLCGPPNVLFDRNCGVSNTKAVCGQRVLNDNIEGASVHIIIKHP